MSNTPLKPFGRSLSDFFNLSEVEDELLEKCRKGESLIIAEKRPEQSTENNTIRADFIRFLALGGDENAPVHEKGVMVQGAWIEGELDLVSAVLPHSLVLRYCSLEIINCALAKINGNLDFDGSKINGNDKEDYAFRCDKAEIKGSVFLRNVNAIGTIILSEAEISRSLECDKSKFDGGRKCGSQKYALMFGGATIEGCVFLRNNFECVGSIYLSGAKIGDSLHFCNAILRKATTTEPILRCDDVVVKGSVLLKEFDITGGINLSRMKIAGSLSFGYDGHLNCRKSKLVGNGQQALIAENMVVAGTLLFKFVDISSGNVSLSNTKVNVLIDDIECFPKEKLILNGFVYDQLSGNAPTDAKTRITWLKKQSPKHLNNKKEFKPQPWQQLQKVLRDMGHFEDARQIGIAFQEQLREANLIGQTPDDFDELEALLYRKTYRGFHWLFGWLIGYGYRPLALVFKMIVVWFFCGAFYLEVAIYANDGNGVFAPSNPLIFQNPVYAPCVPNSYAANIEKNKLDFKILLTNNKLLADDEEYSADNSSSEPVKGAGNWYLCESLREEYTGFSPFLYSLDLILPLVDLQQENDWSPMIPTPENKWSYEWSSLCNLKYWTRFLMWFEILFGWVASLLLVAVLSGLTKRQDE